MGKETLVAQRRRSDKEHKTDTDGGAFIGNDVNAGRDFVGRDYNVTTHVHHHHAAPSKSSRSSRKSQDASTVEATVTNTVIALFHRWFPYIVVLVLLQLLCLPLFLTIPNLWLLLILPGSVLVAMLYAINNQVEHLLRVVGFYDQLSVDKRRQVKDALGQKQWGNWWLNWYTFLLLAFCIQTDKRRLKKH